jgi:integrase
MKGTITKYRKKDGRVSWGYYYKAEGRQFTKSGYATKDAAGDALEEAIRQEKGLPPAPHIPAPDASPGGRKGDTRPVRDYLGYWLDMHAALRCSPKTMEEYRGLAKYLVRDLGDIRLCDLRAPRIQEFVNALQLHGGVPTKKFPQGRPLSAKHSHAAASLLYTCLGDAVRLEHLPMNPMADRRVRLPKRVKQEPAVLDPEMFGKLLDVVRGTRLYPFVVVSGASGCRRGELLALLWTDIDFETGVVTISKSLEQTRAGGLRVKGTKSGRVRRVGLDDADLDVLRDHHAQQREDKAAFGADYRDHGLVFCQPSGGYYSPMQVGARVKEALLKAGLGGFRLHSLRHSHATVLLSQGTPLKVVSERLGHADANITLGVYSHALPADHKAATKAWRNALRDVIAEDRSRKPVQSLEKSRKLAVND